PLGGSMRALRDHPLASGLPEAWAAEWGEDDFGPFVGFAVGDAVQRMRWMPPGRFTMGSPESEAGRYNNETQREVQIESGFWLADTPVTQALWQAVMGNNPSRFVTPDRPVEQVSWDDATEFCARLSKTIPGLAPRLPTEAEWEYACRAGTQTATWLGDLQILGECNAPLLDDIAWYTGNSGHKFDLAEGANSHDWPNKQYPHEKAGTRRVAQKLPNPWGLYDMLGNVYEWCSDPYAGSYRVYRGGSWDGYAWDVRAAYRYWYSPGDRYSHLGFRLARGQK
ncbi:MAG: formylglycine-generating enzyme family protein, partial [Myxococcales bacterium]|nr:formylglycine-generating enzyme family protein [Myxococcales bacterium]